MQDVALEVIGEGLSIEEEETAPRQRTPGFTYEGYGQAMTPRGKEPRDVEMNRALARARGNIGRGVDALTQSSALRSAIKGARASLSESVGPTNYRTDAWKRRQKDKK